MKKIKEERVTRDGKKIKLVDDIPDGRVSRGDMEVDERIQDFWGEMFGLVDLLNFNNKKYIIRSVESNIITDYLLWRILNELKILNIQTKQLKEKE